ncbi:MAG TPA: 30S ribosomal protein S12 methylthiotransferase RimO, partial [Bacteroidia bacterium]|nr:30S ribosomal protein S12 methylthiotransferase RimO [Bacteroidia bacterium]
TPQHYAYLKISEGCDRPCSFCAIPLMRGNHISIPENELVLQARQLAAKGTKELILIAQDLTFYGLDLHKKRTLSDLLKRLSDVEGIDWIRLHYAYPSGFPLDVLDTMKERSNICKYLDMPLQHISDNMLKSMRRGITREKSIELVQTIRDKVPGIAIRTTLIAGYPGETENDYEEMKQWVGESRFDRLGIFTYSHEENTHAFQLVDDVPDEIKKERAAGIMDIQQSISRELNEQKIGQTFKVLFDRKEGNFFVGRTEFDSPEVDNEILVDAKEQYIRVGDFANVKITSAQEFDLFGEVSD